MTEILAITIMFMLLKFLHLLMFQYAFKYMNNLILYRNLRTLNVYSTKNLFILFIYIQINPKSLETLLDTEQV